jgi:hypothetical protein
MKIEEKSPCNPTSPPLKLRGGIISFTHYSPLKLRGDAGGLSSDGWARMKDNIALGFTPEGTERKHDDPQNES